jgi:hypothetical protein
MKAVKLPRINFEDEKYADNGIAIALLDLYTGLGWNPDTHDLDPTKIKLNPADQTDFTNKMLKHAATADLKQAVSMLILQNGPSQDAKVPYGNVWLQKGWSVLSPA